MKVENETRINDIINSGLGIERDEIKNFKPSVNGFICSSTEYHLIIHLTNDEYYYMDDDTIMDYKGASDDVVDTDTYLIMAFK